MQAFLDDHTGLVHTATQCIERYSWNVTPAHTLALATGWQKLVGCLELLVIFGKRATNYRALLRKMTYKIRHSMTLCHPVSYKDSINGLFGRILRSSTHCNTTSWKTTHCNALQYTATHCNKLPNTITHRIEQHTATHCNLLQHAATRCHILKHTATQCYTRQHSVFHRRGRSDLKSIPLPKFQKVFTGVPVTFNQNFTGAPKFKTRFHGSKQNTPDYTKIPYNQEMQIFEVELTEEMIICSRRRYSRRTSRRKSNILSRIYYLYNTYSRRTSRRRWSYLKSELTEEMQIFEVWSPPWAGATMLKIDPCIHTSKYLLTQSKGSVFCAYTSIS